MSTFDYTCKHCNKPATLDFTRDDYQGYVSSQASDITDLSDAARSVYLATRSLHSECFDEVLEKYKGKITAGVYMSQSVFDDDEYREVPVFTYIHKEFEDNKFEVWSINTSSRYVRKGGEFLSKSVNSFEQIVLHFHDSSHHTNEPVETLIKFLAAYAKGVRKDFLQEIMELATSALIDAPFSNYQEQDVLEEYKKFLKECEILELTLFNAQHIAV